MNILVTGGSQGIGKAIVEYFIEKGHNVLSPTHAEMDLIEYRNIVSYLSFKEVDILINCGGINIPISPEERGLDRYHNFNDHMDINFYGSKYLIDEILPKMKKNKYGRILNIGSIWIDIAKKNRGAYSISKAALHALTKQTALENAGLGILCNTLSPGFVETDMTFRNNTDEEISIIQKEIPIQRLAQPNEIAKLAYFLTAENTYINGQNIIIDGGYSICA